MYVHRHKITTHAARTLNGTVTVMGMTELIVMAANSLNWDVWKIYTVDLIYLLFISRVDKQVQNVASETPLKYSRFHSFSLNKPRQDVNTGAEACLVSLFFS